MIPSVYCFNYISYSVLYSIPIIFDSVFSSSTYPVIGVITSVHCFHFTFNSALHAIPLIFTVYFPLYIPCYQSDHLCLVSTALIIFLTVYCIQFLLFLTTYFHLFYLPCCLSDPLCLLLLLYFLQCIVIHSYYF